MRSFLAILFTVSSLYSQTKIQFPELNAEYTPPPSWDPGTKLVDYHEYTLTPIKQTKSIMLIFKQFDDTLSRDKYIYKQLFFRVFQSARVDTKFAATIPAIMDTSIGAIHFIGVEASGDNNAWVQYIKVNGLYLLSMFYSANVEDWKTNRNEYYLNFQNMNFLSVSQSGIAKRQANGKLIDDGSALIFNILGQKISKGSLIDRMAVPFYSQPQIQ